MGFRVFGSAEVLSVHSGDGQQAVHVRKQAHRAVFEYVPRAGYVYVRSRAISSRCNDNFDAFPAEEIEKSYLTFVGKPVFVNHHNSDHKQARGVIIDAKLHRDRNPNGSPDTWVEVLMEVDGITYPKLAKALVSGDIDRTSMGVDVQISKCSACGKEARNPLEYCRHIPGLKGQYLHVLDQKTGQRRPQLIFEICSGLSFFENSLLVEPPADPTALTLGQVDIGPGLDHLAALARSARLQEATMETGPSAPVRIELAPAGQRLVHTAARQGFVVEASKADDWLDENTPSAHHIVAKFLHAKKSDPDAYESGMSWYSDSHHIAKALGGGDTAKAAGLMGVYSAGTPVAPNYHYASRALLHNAPVGGKADVNVSEIPEEHRDFHGLPNANDTQRGQARRMLDGEHHSSVLTSPKVSNYAHLIEHGDDEPGSTGPGRVVIDRHAISAAIGRKITEKEFGALNLASNDNGKKSRATGQVQDYGNDMNPRYHRLANVYRDAADQLRAMGHDVKPHQVQAVAWTVQKKQNDAEEDAHIEANGPQAGNIKGRRTMQERSRDAWETHYRTQHDDAHMPERPRGHWGKLQQPPVLVDGGYYLPRPGESPQERQQRIAINRRQAYNETKAPTDVDTLRDESCPICGNDIVFNGSECQVCGFIQPPHGLDDPDVEKAQQLDQLKQNVEDNRNGSGLDPSQPGAEFDAGDPANAVPGGDNSGNPWLACPSCGTEVRPSAPQTTPADPAQAGAAGPAEGQPCPVCGEGPLASTGVSEDDTNEEAEQAADQDGDGVPDDEEQDEEEGDEPDDEDDDEKNPPKNPAKRVSAAAKYRDHSKEFTMQHGLASLAKLNEQVANQAQFINAQQRQLAKQASQIQRMAASLTVVARLLGPQADEQMRRAAMLKRADEQNPAQPIPEPAPQPPTQTTVQAETPEAFADVRAPGMVPGVNNDVAADAVTTAYTPGQDIGTQPVRQLVDVTAPIEGTQGPLPINQVKTNVDVRAGNPMNPQVAFPLGGDFAQAQRTGSQNELRFVASLRLARLRIQHGIEVGDDLSIGQRIASDVSMTQDRIDNEIVTLNRVQKAASANAYPMPPRGAVPRPAAPAQRIVPPLSPVNGFQATASSQQNEDADLAAALL